MQGSLELDRVAVLEVGKRYRAIGPAEGSKLGPPPEVLVVAVDEEARHYRIEGITPRPAAKVIAFGCEHMWRLA